MTRGRMILLLAFTLLPVLTVHGCAGDGSALVDDVFEDEPQCPPDDLGGAPTLGDVQQQVFDPLCVFCHQEGGFGPFSLEEGQSFGSLVNVPSVCDIPSCQGQPMVIPCHPDDSYLVWKIEADPRIEGVPMPFGTPGLADAVGNGQELIDLVRAWIEAGALP